MQARQRRNFDADWLFILGDSAQMSKPEYNDRHWRRLNLPHDWAIEGDFSAGNPSGAGGGALPGGVGWYRKHFRIREVARYFLEFDGIYMNSTVYINGEKLGSRPYGYSSFEFEITRFLRTGDNVIAVRVDNSDQPNSRWYSGCGIYRHVWFTETSAVHVSHWGVHVETTAKGKAKVTVDVNGRGQVQNTLYDKNGAAIDVATGRKSTLKVPGSQLRLWSPQNPYTYKIRTRVLVDGKVVDEVWTTTAFRDFRFDAKTGFWLNGKNMKINGVCEHHDLGCLGAALNDDALHRKLVKLKQMGCNAIRTSHNPPARQLLTLCDQLGLLVMDELYDMWELPKTAYDNARFFPETYPRSVREWVRRDRCHPCVILWSIGNEIYDMQASEKGQYWTKVLADEVKKHDSRHAAVTFGSNYMPWEGAQKCAEIVRLPGYNYAEKYYAAHHAQHPDWVIYGSETASLVMSRGVYHFPFGEDIMSDEDLQCSALMNSNTSWGARDLRAMLADDLNTPYSLGQFVWSGIDYIGEPTPYHTRSSYFGQADTACFPKDSYYFYQAMWTDTPMIHIGVAWDWNVGQMIDVPVMTNCAECELILNGISLGKRTVDRHDPKKCLPLWRVPFGKGTLEARGYDAAGKLLCQTRRVTSGESRLLVLRADRASLRGGCGEMAFIEVSAIDEKGNPVENACDRISVKVSGNGVLLGLDNGDSTDQDGYQTTSRRLFNGKLLIMVGAQTGPGSVTVEADAPNVRGASLTLPVSKGGSQRFPDLCKKAEIREDVAIRRIDLCPLGPCQLTPENPSVSFLAYSLPALAPEQELCCRVTNATGVDVPCAAVTREGNVITVQARGDGRCSLRVTAKNGDDHPRVISTREIAITGFGLLGLNPYDFVSASLCDIRIGDIGAGNEQGIAFARDGESAAGFANVDFGPVGSDTLTVPIFALDGNRYDIGLWDGVPGQGGEKLCDLTYQKPSKWNVYQPETYRLPRALRGVHTLCFSLDRKIHLKGFRFEKQRRPLRYNPAGEADAVYGDSFRREGGAVLGIGNNVTLTFRNMEFASGGTARLIIRGATPLEVNAIHVKAGDMTTMCDFVRSPEPGEQAFDVQVPAGECEVSFVFLPGCQFDFYGFRFEEEEV